MRPADVYWIAAPPHANSNWFLVMAMTFTRPGRYFLRRAGVPHRGKNERLRFGLSRSFIGRLIPDWALPALLVTYRETALARAAKTASRWDVKK
jgi:hypothetical protein